MLHLNMPAPTLRMDHMALTDAMLRHTSHMDPHTLHTLRVYTDGMTASVASYKREMEGLFAQYSAHANAILVMQNKFIANMEEQHQRQVRDLTVSFQSKYDQLEAQLTEEQMANFKRFMQQAQVGLDLWDDDKHAIDAAAPTVEAIQAFMRAPSPPDDYPPPYPADAN